MPASPAEANLLPYIPQSLEAEQAVLGSMLIEQDAIIRTIGVLSPRDFKRDAHATIYAVICDMHERGDAVDMITLADALRPDGLLDEVGGIAYLTALASTVPTAANVEHYAKIVRGKSIQRALANELQRDLARAMEDCESAERLVAEVADRLLQLATSSAPAKRERHIREIVKDRIDAYETAWQHRDVNGGLTGWPTCLAELDEQTGGLQPSDLIIGAGRPSLGKTALALQIATDGARRTGKYALVIELEMSADQLVDRIVAPLAGLDPKSLRIGRIGDRDWRPLSQAVAQVSELPIVIDDNAQHSTDTVWAMARRVSLKVPIGLIVIDYLQLLTDHGDDDENSRLTRITRRLKAMARDLNVPVLCLSQLSRASEKGYGKPRAPRLSDLRGSGAIEQDADVVMFLHCEEEDSKLAVRPTQLIVAKQRNGPIGDFPLMFDRPKQRFWETDTRHEAPPAPARPAQNRMGEYDNEEGEHA